MENNNHRNGRGGARPGTGPKRKFLKARIADLDILISNTQALLNIAEVKAPSLRNDPQWIALRAHQEQVIRDLNIPEKEQAMHEV